MQRNRRAWLSKNTSPSFGLTLALLCGLAYFAGKGAPPLSATTPTGQQAQLLATASAANATGTVVGPAFMARCQQTAIYIDWGTGVASGAVTIESAVDNNYAGTWAPLFTDTFVSGAPKQDILQITGVHWAIRTRISTVIAGGTVNSWLVCD